MIRFKKIRQRIDKSNPEELLEDSAIFTNFTSKLDMAHEKH